MVVTAARGAGINILSIISRLNISHYQRAVLDWQEGAFPAPVDTLEVKLMSDNFIEFSEYFP